MMIFPPNPESPFPVGYFPWFHGLLFTLADGDGILALILLMVQKSQGQPPVGCIKHPVNTGDFWPYQLVITGFLVAINSQCTTQNEYFLSTWLVACNMQPADSLFSFVAKNGWKNISPSAIGLCGGPPGHQKCRGDPILLFGALDAAAVGPNKNGVVKGRGKRLGKKIMLPRIFWSLNQSYHEHGCFE